LVNELWLIIFIFLLFSFLPQLLPLMIFFYLRKLAELAEFLFIGSLVIIELACLVILFFVIEELIVVLILLETLIFVELVR